MVHVTGHDSRIKAVVSQVPGTGPVEVTEGATELATDVEAKAAQMARGEIDLVPRPDEQPDSLRGVGDFRTMRRYHPRTAARNICVPILILDQEEEEYGGRENSGLAVLKSLPKDTVHKYYVFPGTHYDIYDKNYKESADMARDWFLEHL